MNVRGRLAVASTATIGYIGQMADDPIHVDIMRDYDVDEEDEDIIEGTTDESTDDVAHDVSDASLSPEQILSFIDAEALGLDLTHDILAETKLLRAAPLAVDRLIHIIAKGRDEHAMRAASIVLDRVFGTAAKQINPIVIPDRVNNSPTEALVKQLTAGGPDEDD